MYKTTYKVVSLLLLFLIMSCGDKNNYQVQKPLNLIDKDKMAAILSDVHILESNQEMSFFAADSTNKLYLSYYKYIFDKYDVEESQFKSSFEYYVSQPVLMDSMYSEVIANISKIEPRLKKIPDMRDILDNIDTSALAPASTGNVIINN